MSIILQCPSCSSRLQVQLRAPEVTCPQCMQVFAARPWWFSTGGQALQGPYDLWELQELVEHGVIGPQTNVWCLAAEGGTPLEEVLPDAASPPPLPPGR